MRYWERMIGKEEGRIDWEMREEEKRKEGRSWERIVRKRRIGRRREEYSIRYNNSICMIV